MPVSLKDTSLTLTVAQRLRLPGYQTDAHGTVHGGEQFLFDYLQSGLGDALAAAADVPNLVVGGPNASVLGQFASGCAAARGLAFTEADTAYQTVNLPTAVFDLNTLDPGASFLIFLWATHGAIPASPGSSAIAGFGNTTAAMQWGLALANAGAGTKAYFDGAQIGSYADNVIGVPTLYTIAVVEYRQWIQRGVPCRRHGDRQPDGRL